MTTIETRFRAGLFQLLATWAVAVAPYASLVLGLSIRTNNRWVYLPVAGHWLFAISAVVNAAILSTRNVTSGKRIGGWAAVAVSLFLSLNISGMDSL